MSHGNDVLLLLGSNLGRKGRLLRDALDALPPAVDLGAVSRIHVSEPWGRAGQPWFLNVAALGRTRLSPEALLEYVKNMEVEAGRRPAERWGPRVLDIDILLFGDRVVREPHLTIPHAEMASRRFCLLPAAEIAPDAVVPPGNRTVRELLETCDDPLKVFPI
jgi:2-amino-4-hydroxy-6-hydroxymethyldihydropteridine diphosphokinase